VANWSVRGKVDVDGVECSTPWGHAGSWNSLSFFRWMTITGDMTPYFDAGATEIQIRHRVTDWRWMVGVGWIEPIFTGPGPYMDRTRIGRIPITGPVLSQGEDARSQAQDAYPTEIDPRVTPGTGEHHRPTVDRFGMVAFSRGGDLGLSGSPNVITGDSITIQVVDARAAGGITSVDLHAAIVQGPHAGKAPPPWSAGSNGFFVVPADSARESSSIAVENCYFVDLDDDYFLGGDVLHYFWLATDAQGAMSSDPEGLTAVPGSIEAAQEATQGLLEVSFLPTVVWSWELLQDIDADPAGHGKIDPASDPDRYLSGSYQGPCILYVNRINTRRRSGDINRTSFMYTLDYLGYRFEYDVYDHSGMGDTNNHLGGRATIEQAGGYNLIVYDAGNEPPSGTLLPDGSDPHFEKIDQAGWFQAWLAQAVTSEAGSATLWVLGSDILEERPTEPLYASEMGVVLESPDQGISPNPDVEGNASFTFAFPGATTCVADFTGDAYSLQGGCPSPRDYDGLGASGSAVETHHYTHPTDATTSAAAIVMNSSAPAAWNTILQSHPWFDIRDLSGSPPVPERPQWMLAARVLGCVLRLQCHGHGGTSVPWEEPGIRTPRRTVLHPNVPNPFNPETTIHFDLAHDAHVRLRLYDVAGRHVRTLVDGWLEARAGRRAVWDGRDASGEPAASGVYFCRLEAGAAAITRKMLLVQ
jgi:hypothetical protein